MFNFYKVVKKKKGYFNPNYEKHGFKLPFRVCIAGSSSCGKTNMLCNLIYHMDMTFHKVIICCKSAEEPLYQMLKDKLKERVEIFEDGEIAPLIQDTEETDKNLVAGGYRYSKLIVFDDLMLENKSVQEQITQFYVRGRKFGYSCVYISQNFFSVPYTLRKNCTHYILGRGLLMKDLKCILSSLINSQDKKALQEFTDAYRKFTEQELSVCIIDIDNLVARNKILLEDLTELDIYKFK